jgi:hypothetical protein
MKDLKEYSASEIEDLVSKEPRALCLSCHELKRSEDMANEDICEICFYSGRKPAPIQPIKDQDLDLDLNLELVRERGTMEPVTPPARPDPNQMKLFQVMDGEKPRRP